MAVSVSATAPPLAVTVGAVAPLPSKLPPRLPGFKRTRPDSYGPQIQKPPGVPGFGWTASRSEEHTSELQSLMRISYAVFCLKNTTNKRTRTKTHDKHHTN